MVALTLPNQPQSSNLSPTATMSLKRKASDSSDDIDSQQSSQSKRLKVTFDERVEVRYADELNGKALELVRAEVRRALDAHAAGNSDSYDEIKQLFITKPNAGDAPTTKLLAKYLVAFTSRSSSLGKKSSGLVRAILGSQWLARDEKYIDVYTRFLGALMSAHTTYASSILRMLMENLKALPAAASRPPNSDMLSRSRLYAHVHGALRHLLNLVPSASGTLSSILLSTWPYENDSVRMHVTYVKHLIELIEYAPQLKGEILSLITERSVRLDVQIQVDLDSFEDDEEDSFLSEVLRKQMEMDQQEFDEDEDSDDSDDDSVTSEDLEDIETRKAKELKESIAKLDSTIDLLFEYYNPSFVRGTLTDMDDAFKSLGSHFANIIVPTYRSRHTQFLLFHFAQTTPSLAEHFVTLCIQQVFDKSQPDILKSAAAAYLASFVSRGAHVSGQIARDVFRVLGGQLEHIRGTHEASCAGPDLTRFGTFYAITQALLYMFCFRWRDFLEAGFTPEDADEILLNNNGMELRWAQGLKDLFTRMIYSKLNPLKVCSPAIVTQFARIAHHLRFLYVFPLLETNKRVRLANTQRRSVLHERQTALSTKAGDSTWQLDAYFPFDPYRLPKSKRWLEGDYVEWQGIPGLDDNGGEASDDEEGEESGDDLHEREYASDSSDPALPHSEPTVRFSTVSL